MFCSFHFLSVFLFPYVACTATYAHQLKTKCESGTSNTDTETFTNTHTHSFEMHNWIMMLQTSKPNDFIKTRTFFGWKWRVFEDNNAEFQLARNVTMFCNLIALVETENDEVKVMQLCRFCFFSANAKLTAQIQLAGDIFTFLLIGMASEFRSRIHSNNRANSFTFLTIELHNLSYSI